MTSSDPGSGGRGRRGRLGAQRALEVLVDLDAQLGTVDPDARAVVGLRASDDGSVELVDVELRDNGVLEPPEDADGLVVVTAEDVAPDSPGDGDVVPLRQLLCVLPDGTEVGVYRLGDEPSLRSWRSDVPDESAHAVRPRDTTSNTARRAFGLPSLVDRLLPVTELLARAWLLAVAGEALQRFDAPEGPRDVEVEELEEVASQPLLGGLVTDEGDTPTWEDVHRAAVDGRLKLGPFTVDPEHAGWLDPPGLAQVLDRTLPPVEDLLGRLRVVGDDDAMAWAIAWLMARDWYRPD